MELIDKAAVVAQANIEISNYRLAAQEGILTEFGKGKLEGLEGIVDFLDTLEVKEVDLEKELGKYLDANDIEFSHQIKLLDFAKHFFELGMSVSNKA